MNHMYVVLSGNHPAPVHADARGAMMSGLRGEQQTGNAYSSCVNVRERLRERLPAPGGGFFHQCDGSERSLPSIFEGSRERKIAKSDVDVRAKKKRKQPPTCRDLRPLCLHLLHAHSRA